MQERTGVVYKLVNRETGQYYFGSTINWNNRKHAHIRNFISGQYQQRLAQISKDHPSWEVEKLATMPESQLKDYESRLINESALDSKCCNSNLRTGKTRKVSVERRKKATAFRTTKQAILLSPEGKRYKIKSVKQFCIENDLNGGAISYVINGKLNHHKGWRLPSTKIENCRASKYFQAERITERQKPRELKPVVYWTLRNIHTGEAYESVVEIGRFARAVGISAKHLYYLKKHPDKNKNGWQVIRLETNNE